MLMKTNDLTEHLAQSMGLHKAFDIAAVKIDAPEEGFVEITLKLLVDKEEFNLFMIENE